MVAVASAYQVLAIVAAVRRMLEPKTRSTYRPPVSILKPIRGRDAGFYHAIESHALQRYPAFEMLFGLSDPDDPARADIQRLIANYPSVPIRVIEASNDAPNAKAKVLAVLQAEARHEILLANDSDISVPPDYLEAVVAPLEDSSVGVVTCLYRAKGASFPARLEALGIATDFVPSVLVARLIGVVEFAMGSTMALRGEDLRRIGGFEALTPYLADDYQLGRRITGLGLRVVIPPMPVETNLGAGSWRDVWQHQVRWSRTIRVSRPSGYYGYILTQSTVWCLAAALCRAPRVAAAGLIIRLAAGIASGWGVARDRAVLTMWWLMPVRDLLGCAVWVAGLSGTKVVWRGQEFRLDRVGKLHRR